LTKEQFIEQVALSQEPLRRFLRVLCGGDASRADDIAQEALLKAYMSFRRFEGRAKFSTWLFRIAYNCFCDERKRSEKIAASSLDEDFPDVNVSLAADGRETRKVASLTEDGAEADRRFEHQQLYLAIDALSAPEKAVVLLFYMEEKSIKEIECITGMPSGTVRSHLSRARAHMKAFLSSNL